MNKYARLIVAVTFLLGFGVAANAEIRSVVRVTLPFEFVASGKTLPAGTYTVKRFVQEPFDTLMLTSEDTGTSVFVYPVETEEVSESKTRVNFQNVGDQHFLSAIVTTDYIYNIPVSRSAMLEAAMKQLVIVPVSARPGGK
jgi:hypothetical protein